MGALLSLPLVPVNMAISAVSSCVGVGVSNALCGAFGSTFTSSLATRLMYAFLFVINSILSWISLNDWIIGKLGFLRQACEGEECTGFTAVHRIQASLGMLYLVMACLLAAMPAAVPLKERIALQNGYWRTKIFFWLACLVGNFFIPAGFWIAWGNYVAPIFSFVFIFFGLVLLVDFAHSWAETCLENIEESENANTWKYVLVGSTVGMYVLSFILTIVMYWFFAASGCSMNQAAITLNVVLSIIVSALSVHPTVQEHNSRAGLAQSAMVAIYCTYLTMSAVASEPDDKNCNPLVRSRGTRTFSIVIGAVFTFLAIAYTTTRAASRSSNDDGEEAIAISGEPSQAELRRRALRQAVQEGTLPATALEDTAWLDQEEAMDEIRQPQYNYIIFHLIFLLATQYTATLLTMNVEKDLADDFVPVGRTYFASWMKIVSSWICYGLYAWSLAAPVVLPDRF